MEALPGHSYGNAKSRLIELRCSLAHIKYLNAHKNKVFKGDSSMCLRINEDGSAELNPKDATRWLHKVDLSVLSPSDAEQLWGEPKDIEDGVKRFELQDVGGKNTYHLVAMVLHLLGGIITGALILSMFFCLLEERASLN
jgi:hypothetical protein